MSFEVDRYSSAWAHIALCADLTWATEPPDEFIIANQRLWAQHCRISQVLQDQTIESQNLQINNQCELTEKRSSSSQIQENGNCSGRKSVKDVIPESRLAQFYGNFYYDEVREKCYTNTNEKSNGRGYNGQGCENSDLTECWMLPEVEYWFRKLVDEPSERTLFPRRRRQYRMLAEDDFEINGHRSAASERWEVVARRAGGEEAALAARVRGVRGLWGPAASSAALASSAASAALASSAASAALASSAASAALAAPATPTALAAPRKMRARRRQPRRSAQAPLPTYCLDAPPQLFCDPTCKFQFDPPRPPSSLCGGGAECQRAMGRLSASVQAVMRASAARCPPYRGTNVTRYAPVAQRPRVPLERRAQVWWPRDHLSPRLDHRFQLTHVPHPPDKSKQTPEEKPDTPEPKENTETPPDTEPSPPQPCTTDKPESPKTPKEKVVVDGQLPSTSAAAAAAAAAAMEPGLRKKRLYSTVLSMSAPSAMNLTSVGCVRLSQKLVTPGLLKLNSKIVLPTTRIRPPNVDNKFEELEKEALEQYKASDESIDTKFRELEKQAVEQYSTSNSNTSCSSGHSAEKRASTSPLAADDPNKKQPAKFHKEKAVDSVVIYSQNFPDLNAKAHTTSVTNLKNFHTPPRGEKKEQTHRSNKSLRSLKSESQRAASDTDYDCRETKGSHKGPLRWTLHVVPPKKRHLTVCVSDFSSDEELDAQRAIKDAGPCGKACAAGPCGKTCAAGPCGKNCPAGSCGKSCAAGQAQLSAHGGGDLHPILRKT